MNYLKFSTKFGECAIIYSAEPFRLKKVFLPGRFEKDNGLKADQSHPDARFVSKRIQNYFLGRPIENFDLSVLDIETVSPFNKKVLYAVFQIPFGEVKTYKDIAFAAGNPKASRAAGNALANNPFPIIIPCHRVIKSDGGIGKFGGGTKLKKRILALEKAFL